MSTVVVESCDPRERADDLRALFARNGQPEFAEVFERAYRPRADAGLRSWVGLLDGQVVMHISITPHPFLDGGRRLMGGILGDLMVDASQRDFWAPLRLLRTAVADTRKAGAIGFLLTTTIPDSASLFKAGGFKPFGGLQRSVLPLFGPYRWWCRRRTGSAVWPVQVVEDGQAAAALAMRHFGSSEVWRPEPRAEFYATRLPRRDYADATWLLVEGPAPDRPSGLVLLSRHAEWPELGIGDAFWQDDKLCDVALSVAAWAKRQGVSKVTISQIAGSRVAEELRLAGFITRPHEVPVLMMPLGAERPPPAADWFMTALAGSAW